MQWKEYFHSVKNEMFQTFYLSLHENIFNIVLINIHYLHTIRYRPTALRSYTRAMHAITGVAAR